jgi:D-sedoheptulose 7-phosphate isomerase
MNSKNNIKKIFQESINVKNEIIASKQIDNIQKMGDIASKAILNNRKILICGNGGSAADAQHLAAEMLIRLRPKNNREGVAAISLAQDTSTITACGNDFGFEKLFERMVQTLGNEGDILLAITTSGNSKNIINAMEIARKMEINVFGFLGSGGGPAIKLCDQFFLVPSNNTGRVQEAHITAGHALMEYIEDILLEKNHLHLS